MFGKTKKQDEEEAPQEGRKGYSKVDAEKDLDAIMERIIPEEKKMVQHLLKGFTTEIMYLNQENRMLRKEVKQAVKRKPKGGAKDVMLGKFSLAIFTQPKVDGEVFPARAHFVDNVDGTLAMNTFRRVAKDPDNQFLGFFIMQEMAGKPNGFLRMQANSECVFKLFQELDKSCSQNAPENNPTSEEDDTGFDPSQGAKDEPGEMPRD